MIVKRGGQVRGKESWCLCVCVCVCVVGWVGGEQVEVVNAFSVCVLLMQLQEAGRTRRVCRRRLSRLC
jgi:hypothetical protein